MLKFLDGPAAGKVMSCSRAPIFLRVVSDAEGNVDALDQLCDVPKQQETVTVYVKAEDHGWVHYDGRDKHGKRFGRTEQCADYRLYERQPDDATARDNWRWRQWCQDEHERKLADVPPATPAPLPADPK